MNKQRKILTVVIPCVLLVAFLSIRTAIAYLIDTENQYNDITFGKVSVEVSEPDYEDSKVVAAGSVVAKAPRVNNNGLSDEYVFCCVAIPKKEVTLLYEDTTDEHSEGTPVDAKDYYEIYRVLAEGDTSTGAVKTAITATNTPKDEPALSFYYNKGDPQNEGWIYLGRKIGNTSSETPDLFDYYYFGYNKRLAKGGSTIPLFDKVQLKSFIDEELITCDAKTDVDTEIKITAYGVQADSLNITGLESDILSDENIGNIFGIVKNKEGVSLT